MRRSKPGFQMHVNLLIGRYHIIYYEKEADIFMLLLDFLLMKHESNVQQNTCFMQFHLELYSMGRVHDKYYSNENVRKSEK